MNDELPENDALHYAAKADDFNESFKALLVAEWVINPTDPTNTQGGSIRKGETVWFHGDHFGSGPDRVKHLPTGSSVRVRIQKNDQMAGYSPVIRLNNSTL